MNLLITGGAGFIGSNFLNLLAEGQLGISPSQVTVIDKLTYAADLQQIQPLIDDGVISFVYGDISDTELIEKLVKKNDHIVNFAAESHVDNSIIDSAQFVKTNILGTNNILSSITKHPKTRFLQVSTDEVYGSINQGAWDEQSPLKPNSPYSASKASADLIVMAMHRTHKVNTVITRCSNNYGPRQNSEKLIPKLIMQALNSEELTLYGNGENIREWIHVNDHCKAIAWAIENGASGEVFNVGSGVEYSNLEIAAKILELIPETESEIRFVPDRPGHDLRYSVDDSRIRNFGFRNDVEFSLGLRDTIAWYRKRLFQLNNKGK